MGDNEVGYEYRIAGDDPTDGGYWSGARYVTAKAAAADVAILAADPTWWGDVWVERRPLGEWERVS